MKDFYYILGTNENSTQDEIKDAYRKLSKKFHPDLNQNDKYFESHFKEIQQAYEFLSDPAKRKRYDEALKRFQSNTTAKNSKVYKSKTRGIDIGFTLVLFFLTLIFGAYVLKATSYSPKAKASKIIAADTTAYIPLKHHNKKHSLKTKYNDDSQKITLVKTAVVPAQTTAINTHLTQPVTNANVKPVSQPLVDSDQTHASKNFPYASMIRSNLTGVVYMKKSNNFSSIIIAKIPTNSEVYVLEKGSDYYKVQYDNNTGYIPKWTVKTK